MRALCLRVEESQARVKAETEHLRVALEKAQVRIAFPAGLTVPFILRQAIQ